MILQSLNLKAVDGRVLLSVNGEPIALVAWKAAKEAAIGLKVAAGKGEPVVYPLETDLRPVVLELRPEDARRVSAALHAAGALAEEQTRATAVAEDQAVLIRTGATLRLTSDSRIFDEAWKEAQWASEFRRIPLAKGYVPTAEKFGTLILTQKGPTNDDRTQHIPPQL